MVSAGSPGVQEILRCESPGVIPTSIGGNGGASANFTGTEAVESWVPWSGELMMYCTHSVLLIGFAEERDVTLGSSQGCTPASEEMSTICWALTLNASVCCVGVWSRKD